MKRVLIAYHSRSGATRRVARALAGRLGADVEEIRIVQPLTGALGYVFCAIESLAGLTPALRAARHDPAAYDLVIVGTPVWFWDVSSPVRSWLEQHRRAGRRVAFFCTMGSSGAARAFGTMRRLAGRAPIATLALTQREVEAGAQAQLSTFVGDLKAPPAAPTRARVPAHAAA